MLETSHSANQPQKKMKRFFMKHLLIKIAALVVVLGVLATTLTLGITHSIPTHAAAYSEPCPATISQGSRSTWVQVAQVALNSYEFNNKVITFPHYPLATDGIFGANTKGAVAAFQRVVLLPANGVIDARTWSSMGFCTGKLFFAPNAYPVRFAGPICPPRLSTGSSGVWVQALQQMLNIDVLKWAGNPFPPIAPSYKGQTWWPLARDGKFGAHTALAVKAFQAHNGLAQDGIVGAHTWGATGICY